VVEVWEGICFFTHFLAHSAFQFAYHSASHSGFSSGAGSRVPIDGAGEWDYGVRVA
jgi:hypothetical protein